MKVAWFFLKNTLGKMKFIFLFATATAIVFTSCQSIQKNPLHERKIASDRRDRTVVYITSWNRVSEEYLKQRKLSHVIYAFALPGVDSEGAIRVYGPRNFLHNKTHYLAARSFFPQTKAMIAIGGYSNAGTLVSKDFEKIVNMQDGVEKLSQAIMNICEEFRLDGVDMDWEFPTTQYQTQFVELLQNLRVKMDRSSTCKILTVAVPTRERDAEGFGNSWFNLVDFVNIMAYDFDEEMHHSSYEHAQNALHMWTQKGLESDKAVLGVPFYSKPRIYKYSQIYDMNSKNSQYDETESPRGLTYYNGESTIRRKAQLAKQYGGIMVWELGQDSTKQPLMSVIEEEMGR